MKLTDGQKIKIYKKHMNWLKKNNILNQFNSHTYLIKKLLSSVDLGIELWESEFKNLRDVYDAFIKELEEKLEGFLIRVYENGDIYIVVDIKPWLSLCYSLELKEKK